MSGYSALYGLVHANFARVGDVIRSSLSELVLDGPSNDPRGHSGLQITPEQIFLSISTLLLE
jgi:hypothetical protein